MWLPPNSAVRPALNHHPASSALLVDFQTYICMLFHREHPNGVRVGLHNSNLLLRSCTIRNTETVVGIVVYAGKSTESLINT